MRFYELLAFAAVGRGEVVTKKPYPAGLEHFAISAPFIEERTGGEFFAIRHFGSVHRIVHDATRDMCLHRHTPQET